ncbi:unnamed protein product [Boreogadus saida]
MLEHVESLDMRELDMGEGEEVDFDGNCLVDCRIPFSAVYKTRQQGPAAVFKIELRHGEVHLRDVEEVRRKEKHFMELHRELLRYKTFMRIPLPSRSHTVRRKSVRRVEVREMPSCPGAGGDELARDGQVSSRETTGDYINKLLRMAMYRKYHHTMSL